MFGPVHDPGEDRDVAVDRDVDLLQSGIEGHVSTDSKLI